MVDRVNGPVVDVDEIGDEWSIYVEDANKTLLSLVWQGYAPEDPADPNRNRETWHVFHPDFPVDMPVASFRATRHGDHVAWCVNVFEGIPTWSPWRFPSSWYDHVQAAKALAGYFVYRDDVG